MFGRRKKTQVLVVGAGPVGLFAALQLARQGLSLTVIDSQWRTAARSYALALHPRSLELLREAGLARRLVEAGRRVETLGLYDRDRRRAQVDLGSGEGEFPFVLVMPQNRFEEALEEALADAGVTVLWSHRLRRLEVGDSGATAEIEQLGKDSTGYSVASTEWVVEKTHRVDARFVVGADGYHSAVRRLSGLEFEDFGRAQRFAVFECETDGDAGSEMRVALGDEDTSVYWPLAGSRFRWSFELRDGQATPERLKSRLAVQVGEEAFPYLQPESLTELIAERAPWFSSRVASIAWSVGVRFERRLAAEFGRGPVSLIGDAAHVAGPVGVQSMNAGLAEGADLAGLLESVEERGASPRILESFHSGRQAEWRRLLQSTVERLESAAVDQWLGRRAARLPACLPATGDDLGKLLSQLGLQLAD